MSAQDKMERILKDIHLLVSEGEPAPGDPEKVIIEKKELFSILENLNLAVYEMMDQYEATNQAREMAQRRSEKQGEEILAKVSAQADDIYAASLIYTDDALLQAESLMDKALEESRGIWLRLKHDLEKEKQQIHEDQKELREQLQDFKDSEKYLGVLEERNREREKEQKQKEGVAPEKRIQNEAKHYSMRVAPEIKINTAYFQRRGLEIPGEEPVQEAEAQEHTEAPAAEIYVDLDSEYFKWKEQENQSQGEQPQEGKSSRKERKGRWGKR